MRRMRTTLIILGIAMACSGKASAFMDEGPGGSSSTDEGLLTSLVDPFIGTGGHGHVFLGANVPFGLVQLGPTEPVRGW